MVDHAHENGPDLVLETADVVVYTAILGTSMLPMLFFGRAWAVVGLIGLIAAWASPRIVARLIARLRRWLGRP